MAAALPPGVDLSTIPTAPNPSGAPPNFTNPPNQYDLVLYAGLPLVIITCLFVCIRIATNLKVGRKLLVDDYCCVSALALAIAYYGLCASLWPTARHAWDVPLSFIDASYLKRTFAKEMIVGPAFGVGKMTIMFLYLRVFRPKVWLRISCYVLLLLTLTYWVNVPLSLAWCIPRNGKPWDFEVATRCAKLSNTSIPNGAVSIFIDVVLFILPFPIIWELQLSFSKKISLAMVFLVAFCAIVTSVVSMYFRVKIFHSLDQTWDAPKIDTCAVIEAFVTITVSCAPSMSSFWTNTVVKSSFYSSYISSTRSTTFGRSRSATEKGTLPSKAYKGPESTSNLVHKNGAYIELGEIPRPETYVTSDGTQAFGSHRGITKATTIKQSSQSRMAG